MAGISLGPMVIVKGLGQDVKFTVFSILEEGRDFRQPSNIKPKNNFLEPFRHNKPIEGPLNHLQDA